ncbi:thioredoxin reductase GliT [Cryptococcus neoformans A2-102-5]|nr:thioredoxin reductase GliT [Cryptococcus neoformans var. grubii D17-1]OXG91499.1 thioredoxin reductase GliT [Cryptococcus neoformans var. grubii A2-102-5]
MPSLVTKAIMSTTKIDLLIIGGGPAGLSAAITFSRLRRSCVIYDSGDYRNASASHSHTILGFEGQNPADYRAKVRSELLRDYNATTTFRNGQIVSLVKVGEDFEAKDAEGNTLKARKVILATGVKDHLPDIAGVSEQWGKRIIHCIFCHGTETANQPFAFVFTPNNVKLNPLLVAGMLKLWGAMDHQPVYILTHGSDVSTEEGRREAGLETYWEVIQNKGYQVISSPIQSIKENDSKTSLIIEFADHPSISVPYMLLFPEKITPSDHGSFIVNEELLGAPLGPMGTIPAPTESLGAPKMPPRMGDDPRTPVEGLFWAGNSGSMPANVTISAAQGSAAAIVAADELGTEDLIKFA